MPFHTNTDIVPISLKNDIKNVLAQTQQDLEIGTDVWDGDSKSSYNAIKQSAVNEINIIFSMIGGL